MKRLLVPLAPVLAAAHVPALAQAYQCRIPDGPVSVPEPDRGPEVRARTTGYTLAASWSPEYCRTRTRSEADARQCSGRAGRFGMILHGLWPEGRWRSPQWCETGNRADTADVRPMLCATPSARLLAHEWARHGSCMARRPATYFRIERILWDAFRWPDLDRLSRQRGLTAGDVRTALAAANPLWRPEWIGLEVNESGWLEGVRFCMGPRFESLPCDRRRFGPADDAAISIWRGL